MPTAAERLFITPVFRMSNANVITPKRFKDPKTKKEKGDPTFSLTGIFEPDDMKKWFMVDDQSEKGFTEVDLAATLVQIAKEKWSGIDVKAEFAKAWPIKAGDAKAAKLEENKKNGDYLKGKKTVNFKSKEDVAPRLIVWENGVKTELNTTDPEQKKKAEKLFVSGYYARALVKVMATEMDESKYLTFYLNEVRFVKVGEKIGGTSAMDRFEGVYGGSSDHDPTAGLDEEIPF